MSDCESCNLSENPRAKALSLTILMGIASVALSQGLVPLRDGLIKDLSLINASAQTIGTEQLLPVLGTEIAATAIGIVLPITEIVLFTLIVYQMVQLLRNPFPPQQ